MPWIQFCTDSSFVAFSLLLHSGTCGARTWYAWCFFFVSSVNPHSERASFIPANFSLSFKSEEGRRVELLQSVHRSRSPCCQDDLQGSTKNWDASVGLLLALVRNTVKLLASMVIPPKVTGRVTRMHVASRKRCAYSVAICPVCGIELCVEWKGGEGMTLLRCTQSGGMRLLYSDDFFFFLFFLFFFGLF